MLPSPISSQRLKTVPGRDTQITKYAGLIQKTKFPQRDVLNVRRKFSAPPSGPDQIRLGIGETLNHGRL
jgi:hypothetical protein